MIWSGSDLPASLAHHELKSKKSLSASRKPLSCGCICNELNLFAMILLQRRTIIFRAYSNKHVVINILSVISLAVGFSAIRSRNPLRIKKALERKLTNVLFGNRETAVKNLQVVVNRMM